MGLLQHRKRQCLKTLAQKVASFACGVFAVPLADIYSLVDSLLNPCTCKAFNCRCAPRPSTQSSIQAQAIALSRPVGGLKALAQAATELQSTPQASCCGGAAKDPVARSITPPNPTKPSKRTKYQHDVTEPSSCCTPAAPVLNPATTEDYTFDYPNSPLLPALDDPIFSPAPIATAHKHSTSDAMSCTCGATCSCPGCSEHRGTEHAHGKDCTGGSCSTCVDWHAGVALPEHTGFLSTSTASVEEDEESSNIFARFLRQAASLPEPPKSRVGLGPSLDPSHVPDFFAFGLKEERVAIPRLECCNGNCGCPDGTCGCGKTCDGCCTEHSKNTIKPNISKDKNLRSESPKASAEPEKVLTPRSCCAGK